MLLQLGKGVGEEMSEKLGQPDRVKVSHSGSAPDVATVSPGVATFRIATGSVRASSLLL